MKNSLRISGKMHESLYAHLFPGDGNEAVAFLLCNRHRFEDDLHLLVSKVVPIPYEQCAVRKPDLVNWSTSTLEPFLEKAMKENLAVVKVHSHPTGYRSFSVTDDKSDRLLYESVYGWLQEDLPHASMVMLPSGELFGRIILPDLSFVLLDKVAVAGDDLRYWFREKTRSSADFNLRTEQAFGLKTTNLLKRLKVAVIGCSGTGSVTVELLARLGVGELVLVDPDVVEVKNLNRIVNSTMDDAVAGRFKVDVLKEAIEDMGLGTIVTTVTGSACRKESIVSLLSSCDVLFGCVDSVDGRHILNHVASFYVIPYFDMGVKIIADGKGGVDHICGAIHFMQPGGSSLRTRGVYTLEEWRATLLYQLDFEEYQEQRKSGYIVNVNVESPAVISINMQVASMAINEFLARIHLFRDDPNSSFAIRRLSLTGGYGQDEPDGEPDPYLQRFVGHGTTDPLLNMIDSQ